MKFRIAIIVDAYSTGSRLAGEFKKSGIDCVHIQSSKDIPFDFLSSYRSEDFINAFVVDEYFTIESMQASLPNKEIICVIPGTETGVETAERIARKLGLQGNDPDTSSLRRNKFHMHEALRKARLSWVKQIDCTTVEEAINWAEAKNIWPLVAKPTSSAGADGVMFCHSAEEIRHAARMVIGQSNKLGLKNESIVLQEQLVGQQFIVNAVSLNGEHFVSEIWRDDKTPAEGASLICDREVLLPAQSTFAKSISKYVIDCLNVLGITDGPSHSELFQCEDGQFVLIETAARMQGTIDHKAVIEATGHSHVTLTALRYAEPDSFATLLGTDYLRRNHLHCVTLCSRETGVVTESKVNAKISTLPSFKSLIHTPNVGDQITKTIDLFTNPGIVYLAHHDESILDKDYDAIRQMEINQELFTVSTI